MPDVSILNPLGYQESTCGYCSPAGERSVTNSSYSTGMQPIKLTCQTYQDMIDRGWRRSGTYCYKPDLRRSCCPQYTIKLDSLSFKPSKSQRKLVTRWNRHILGGSADEKEAEMDVDKPGPSAPKSTKTKRDQNQASPLVETIHATEQMFLSGTNAAHRFEVTLEPASFTQEKFKLYAKYQSDIHLEDDKKPEGFRRFLVETPLIRTKIKYSTTPPRHLPTEYGSYHQMYRVDGKLIAIGVVDILPACVSSVYFMYDTAWEKFSLGKFSALREATLAREIHDAGAQDMQYLYMGFYIYSCAKMRYKGEYAPSYLADPETYDWYPIEKCIPLLKTNRYSSFSHPEHNLGPSDPIPPQESVVLSDAQVQDVLIVRSDTNRGGVVPLVRSAEWREPHSKGTLSTGIAALGPAISRKVVFAMMYSWA